MFNSKTHEKIQRAKYKLTEVVPAAEVLFTRIDVLKARKERCKNVPIWAKKTTIYYNEELLDKYTTNELAYLIMHEAEHILWGHTLAPADGDRTVINNAYDQIVNSSGALKALWSNIQGSTKIKHIESTSSELLMGVMSAQRSQERLPGYRIESLYKSTEDKGKTRKEPHNGETCEEYNNHFWNHDNTEDEDKKNPGGDGEGEGEGEGQGEGQGQGQGQGDGQGQGQGEGMPEMSQKELDDLSDDLASMAENHGTGNTPSRVQHSMDKAKIVRVNWGNIVCSDLATLSSDYSFQKPRRFGNCLLAGEVRDNVPYIEVLLDVSGSMSSEDIKKGIGNLFGFLGNFVDYNVNIHQFDCGILHSDMKVNPQTASEIIDNPVRHGCGGTSLNGVYKQMKDMTPGKGPDALIIITDGYLDTSATHKGGPVDEKFAAKTFWVLTEHHRKAEAAGNQIVLA